MAYQLRTRTTDNNTLLAHIVIMDRRMQNENNQDTLAEMERVRASMVAAYRSRLTEETIQ